MESCGLLAVAAVGVCSGADSGGCGWWLWSASCGWWLWLWSASCGCGLLAVAGGCGLLAVAACGWLWPYLGLFILTLGKK